MSLTVPRHGPVTKIGIESLPDYPERIVFRSECEHVFDPELAGHCLDVGVATTDEQRVGHPRRADRFTQ